MSHASRERLQADYIIGGNVLLTMNDTGDAIESGAVAIKDGIIVAVDSEDALLAQYLPDEILRDSTAIIMPGLVNTHAHAAMTLFRGSADDLELGGFLETVWDLEKRYISSEAVKVAASAGFAEMALGGITACADMYWYPESSAAAAVDIGMRLATGTTYIDFAGVDNLSSWDDRIAAGIEFIQAYQGSELITPLLCPHAVYSATMAQLTQLSELATQHDVGVHIHAAEAKHEVDLVREKTGLSPVGALDAAGLLSEKNWLAHAVHVSDPEIALLAERKVGVAHCPVSNMKLASGVAPVAKYLQAGVKLGIGTDGPSSSNDLNLWFAMRTAGLLQKLHTGDPTSFPARDIVHAATRGGAQVLSLADRTGSLEVGKAADLIMVSCDDFHGSAIYDPYSHLVYAARPTDVSDVFVNGERIVKDRQLAKVDAKALMQTFKETLSACQ
jgi:5-methylthioadenosine/S-adenosylhomocysteine deaminase